MVRITQTVHNAAIYICTFIIVPTNELVASHTYTNFFHFSMVTYYILATGNIVYTLDPTTKFYLYFIF